MSTAAQSSVQGLVLMGPENELDDSYTIDIVAVPGLGADPDKSFVSEAKPYFDWLSDVKDGIISEIKTARVMKYQYDSRWLGEKALKQTLYNVAELLLDSLVAKRKGHETRPLMFLAHSMGGLVVAKALTLAISHPEKIDRMRIYECFAGAIFFGTPFGGSAEVARGYMLASFLENFDKGLPSQMLQVLDPERDSLTELTNDFAQLVMKDPSPSIACIYEQRETHYLKEKFSKWVPQRVLKTSEIVVSESSATLKGVDEIRGWACDHRQLNRFDNAKDGRYDDLKVLLRNIEKKARLIVKGRLKLSKLSVVDDATFEGLSASLNIIQFRQKRKNIESASGNSEWIINEPKFLQWMTPSDGPSDSKALWISGPEGLGKSKAALAAIERFEKEEKKRTSGESEVMVAYFFCDSTADSLSAENLLKSLMWQLILKRRSLAQHVRGFASQENAKSAISLSKLWKGLQEMLRDDSSPSVYFVINNLHCLSGDDPSTNEFLEAIKDSIENSTGIDDPIHKNVKWMFLSRARVNIQNVLQESADGKVLRINLEDGTKDKELRHMLKVYTQDRVKTLAALMGYSLALQYFVTSVLMKRAENNKLWVEVVCCLLEAIPSNHVLVRKTLESLPQDVKTLMNRVWAESLKSNGENIHRTKEILRTLAIVYEDPTLDELKVLAELDDSVTEVQDQVRSCGPLLRIYADDDVWGDDSGSSRVTFIHDEAKKALLSEKSSRELIGLSDNSNDQTEIRWQHGILALRSFSYALGKLDMEDESNLWVKSEHGDDKGEDSAPELEGLFPENKNDPTEVDGEEDNSYLELEYPVKYWLRHGYEATPDFVDTLDLKNAFWALESSVRRRWWNSYASNVSRADNIRGELKGLTAMHVAAYFGLTPLIDALFAHGHGSEIKVRDSWNHQPLHWAAERGHIDAMIKLMDNKADINDGEQDHFWTPLQKAASTGQIEAMKLLLSGHYGKANVDAIADGHGTALTLAISNDHLKAAELLLDYGANPTLAANGGESPIAIAAHRGHQEFVATLWKKGGGHSLASKKFGSALAAAASAGYESIVRQLLGYSSEVASQYALGEAARHGFHLIVKLLLESSQHLECNGAFQTAASLGYDPVLEELWNHNERYNGTIISQNAINNALYMATDGEQKTTVDVLLDCYHADPNAHGDEYGNAVTASAYDGSITILSKLIEHGADLNASLGHPLQAAASQGHLDVVKMLLDNHASVNASSPHSPDGRALQAACVARQTEVAKELLHRGADPNLGGGTMTNPITAATTNGLGDLVLLLLEKGANPNVLGGEDPSTPLINAACTLRAEFLEKIIKSGALVNTADPDGDTALIMSAFYGDIDCVRTLLDHHADVNFCGKHKGTALHAAAANGYAKICVLLLDHGANPTIRGGPYDTVVQAAAYSGNKDCMKALLGQGGTLNWRHNIDVDAQGGKKFTPLHAAAADWDDGCLRLLLERKPKINIVPLKNPEAGTPLYAAAFAGCNRNARLLLEAGADPNIGAGKSGTVLQVAALKCSTELCDLLINHKVNVHDWSGKYGSALVAAVVRDYHEDDTSVLEFLLGQDFTSQAYRAALEKAFVLQRKDAFKLIWQSVKSKTSKKPNLNTKQLIVLFQSRVRQRSNDDLVNEDANSDFGDDTVNYYQDLEDEEPDYAAGMDGEEKKAVTNTNRDEGGQASTNVPGNGSRDVNGDAGPGTSSGDPYTIGGADPYTIGGADPDASSGDPDASSGDPDASSGDPDASSGDPDASSGDPDASSGDPDASSGDPDASSGDPDASSGDPVASGGDPDTSTGDPDASSGDPVTSGGDPDTSTGDPDASTGDPGTSSGYPEPAPDFTDPGTSSGDPGETPDGENIESAIGNKANHGNKIHKSKEVERSGNGNKEDEGEGDLLAGLSSGLASLGLSKETRHDVNSLLGGLTGGGGEPEQEKVQKEKRQGLGSFLGGLTGGGDGDTSGGDGGGGDGGDGGGLSGFLSGLAGGSGEEEQKQEQKQEKEKVQKEKRQGLGSFLGNLTGGGDGDNSGGDGGGGDGGDGGGLSGFLSGLTGGGGEEEQKQEQKQEKEVPGEEPQFLKKMGISKNMWGKMKTKARDSIKEQLAG